jgi:hypothetical protein
MSTYLHANCYTTKFDSPSSTIVYLFGVVIIRGNIDEGGIN